MFKRIRHRKALRFVSLVLALAMLLSMNVFAVTYNTSYGTVNKNGQQMNVAAFINYASNTTESIQINSLGFWVTNTAGGTVTCVNMITTGGDQSNKNYVEFVRDTEVSIPVGAKQQRYEKDWATACWDYNRKSDTVFIKNNSGSQDYVLVSIATGPYALYVAGWDVFFYETGIPQASFHG